MVLKALTGMVIVEIIERADQEIKTDFLLVKPQFQGVPQTGIVEAVGEGISWIATGDTVVFDANPPRGFKLEGRSFFRLKIDQVEALVKK